MKKWLLLLAVEVSAQHQLVDGLYCGIENCYDVLDVDMDATANQIRKKYKKFAVDLHPDKHPNASPSEKVEIEAKFKRIVTAFETLKNEREDYDEFLQNPEQAYYKYYQYYRRKLVSPNIDLKIVFSFLILCVSALQWTGWNSNYQQAVDYMYFVDKYRLAAKREAESRGLIGNKKMNKGKTQLQIKEEEKNIIKSIIEEKCDIRGGYKKPVWTDLFFVQVFVWPYYLYNWFAFYIRWYVKFVIMKEEYGEVEKEILIKKNLRSQFESSSQWEEMFDEKKELFFEKELWIKSNADEYIKQKEEAERQERAESTKWKQYRRFMKTEAAKRTITFDDE